MSSNSSAAKGRSPFASAPGLNDDARNAVNSAFEAMNEWRGQLATLTERNSDQVFEQMTAAAKAAGWPTELVDVTRQQIQGATRMQMQMVDQVMEVWERQITSPGSGLATGNAFTDSVKNLQSTFPGGNGLPAFDMNAGPMAPLQFWMQAADMWQKSWQQALSSWSEAQGTTFTGGKPGGPTGKSR